MITLFKIKDEVDIHQLASAILSNSSCPEIAINHLQNQANRESNRMRSQTQKQTNSFVQLQVVFVDVKN